MTSAPEAVVAELASKPARSHLPDWLGAARSLLAAGEYQRASLVLGAALQAHHDCVDAHVLLVQAQLRMGSSHWPAALQAARAGLELCAAGGGSSSSSDGGAAADRARCLLALGQALGSVARNPAMPQAERSKHRSEARTALQESAEQPGSHRVHSLYALALIDAEGGHYEQAVVTAQQALQAAEEAPRPCSALAPTVALLGLLLSARQQLAAGLSIVDAGLGSLSDADRCDCASGGALHSVPACHDVLLLRVRALLLLAMADANEALAVLGSARRRLVTAKRVGHGRPAAAAAVLRQQEAQVWRDLALTYASQQQVADAQLCVGHMAALEPHSAPTYHALGVVAAAAGDAVAAKQAYRTALALDASYAPALLSLGALLRCQGDVHDLSVAAGLLTDALRYEPHSHGGWYHLGLSRRAQGHAAEAERHLFASVTLAAAAPVLSYRELPLVV